MAETRFEVRFESNEDAPDRWDANGLDRVEFFVSPNPGEDPRPLARIASGGELSRIMLALRTHGSRRPARSGAGSAGRKTLIFDEVDAGIGGRAAEAVGRAAAGARGAFPGAVHHAPGADRRASHDPVRGGEAGGRRAHRDSRDAAG